jgi:hypothetical protein
MLAQFTEEDESRFLPQYHNASLGGVPFHTATLEGHGILHNIQMKRAEEGGWGKYPHAESRNMLIGKIQDKQKK